MIGSSTEIIPNPLAEADRQWEVGFVYGNPATQGILKEGQWNLNLAPLLDTEMFRSATGRIPVAAEIFEENVRTSLARLNRVGRSSPTLTNAGRALWSIGNAIDASLMSSLMFEEALKMDLTFAPARLALGRAQVQVGEYDSAYATTEPLLYDEVYAGTFAGLFEQFRCPPADPFSIRHGGMPGKHNHRDPMSQTLLLQTGG